MTDFARAAAVYQARGLTAHPLVLDPDGFAKLPLHETTWLHYTPDDNLNQEWDKAFGIGIVLGKASGNLAVLDVDDAGLAEALEAHLCRMDNPPLIARTPRSHLHVFVVESSSSVPVDIECRWQDRWAKVELLARTRQVAVYPTPGYRWLNPTAEPLYGNVGAIWHRLARELNLNYRLARFTTARRDWSRRLP